MIYWFIDLLIYWFIDCITELTNIINQKTHFGELKTTTKFDIMSNVDENNSTSTNDT